MAVWRSEWVKNPNIKKCSFKSTSPKAIGHYVQPGTILCVYSGCIKGFTCDWLQGWFSSNAMTGFFQKRGSEVTQLIMPDWRKPSSRTGESMLHWEGLTTYTMKWNVWWNPTRATDTLEHSPLRCSYRLRVRGQARVVATQCLRGTKFRAGL